MRIDEFQNPVYRQALKIENLLSNDWCYIGSGRHRRVWKRRNVVLKIPYNSAGKTANKNERCVYSFFKKDGIYAPCRLLKNDCLLMWAVHELDDSDSAQEILIPKWAWSFIDDPQVGIRDGRILAYDFSEEFYKICRTTGDFQ